MTVASDILPELKQPNNDRSSRSKDGIKRAAKLAVFVAILSYLTYQLSKIGWSEIAGALPTSPVFYLLSIGFVAAPILAEIFVFQVIVRRKAVGQFRLFLRKHVLNKAVMNFSGDAYFVQQLSQQHDLGLRKAAIIMKDMTLLRAFSANFWIVLLGISAVIFGNWDVLRNIATTSPGIVIAVTAFCVTFCGGAVLLFRKLTRLDSTTALKVVGIYLFRALVVAMILVTQWSFAIPGNEIATWFIFLIVFMLSKKSPVGGELLFASIIVSLPSLSGDSAAIAAMLIAIAAVTQVIYLLGFLMTIERGKRPEPIRAPAGLSPAPTRLAA